MTVRTDAVSSPFLEPVVSVVEQVLDVDDVRATDEFVALGGNSVLALRLLGRIHQELGVRVPSKAVFTAASVADLVRHVEAAAADSEQSAPARPKSRPPAGATTGRASLGQEWALLSSLRDPGAPALQFHVAYHVRGPLEPTLLRKSLQSVIDRHSALRTRFSVADDAARQHVDPTATAELSVEDVSGHPPEHRARHATHLLRAYVRQPFDRSRAPLTRALLVRCAENEHLVAFAFDHLIADGWSLDLFTRDLSTAYARSRGDATASLTAAADYAGWAQTQRAGFDAGRLDEVAAYWRDQLGPDPEDFALRLPGYRSNDGLHGPAALDLDVAGEVATALAESSRAMRVSPYCTGMAALKALIADLTGRRRVTLLSSCANRLDAEYQQTIGWFANGVFPTTTVDLTASFRDLVAAVQDTVLGATAHGDLPAMHVRRRIWPTLPAGFRKEPGVYFMQNEMWGNALRLAGAEVALLPLEEDADSPGLHLWLLQDDAKLRLHVLHYESEYSREYVGEFAETFLRALHALTTDPDARVGDVVRQARR
ncbi:condensation domain-containing protein [Mangrovihabitans endophyticus]|uniref:Carrier domain-containing protein n=1 Tax=Mangrovihabitans endophyticus TaxID=1751298 RepID=A0A8J3BY24_9ACTN|nr:condensation domain-containing protein [Mangrovihabitans endophyticus]GGK78882.1 hypothetical protein GCM10012284_11010 [Mangrovihabitans endophyticus]